MLCELIALLRAYRKRDMNVKLRSSLLALAVVAHAAGASAFGMTTAPSAVSLSGTGVFGQIDRNFSPLAKPAQYYYCRRDCKWCRSDCYNTYRINCFYRGCRQQFVLCMRACWNNICRNC